MNTHSFMRFDLAGRCVQCSFTVLDTEHIFHSYPRCEREPDICVQLSMQQLINALPRYWEGAPLDGVEAMELPYAISDALLEHGLCLFHCSSVIYEGKAYAFTAPSGTGKTTHMRLWKQVYGDAVTFLNGDSPLLEARPDGSLWLHPSPWMGSEGIGSMQSAPLAGVVLLKQARENRIEPLTPHTGLVPVLQELRFTRTNGALIPHGLALVQKLLALPAYKLMNLGDEAAAILCHNTLTGGRHEPL